MGLDGEVVLAHRTGVGRLAQRPIERRRPSPEFSVQAPLPQVLPGGIALVHAGHARRCELPADPVRRLDEEHIAAEPSRLDRCGQPPGAGPRHDHVVAIADRSAGHTSEVGRVHGPRFGRDGDQDRKPARNAGQ